MLSGRAWRWFRDEDAGFSLMELLAAMLVSGVVLTALMTVFTTGLTNMGKANDRVEGTQRARLAVDRVTTLLNAQVCLTTLVSGKETLVPPILAGSNGSSVTFYGDLKGASDTPDRYTLTFDGTAHTLSEQKVVGSGAMPNTKFTAAPTGKKVTPKLYQARVGATVQPVFQYYAFNADGTLSSTPLAVPLTAATAPTVAKVAIALAGAGDHSNQPDTRATSILGEAIPLTTDPTIDPTDPTSTPTVCPKS